MKPIAREPRTRPFSSSQTVAEQVLISRASPKTVAGPHPPSVQITVPQKLSTRGVFISQTEAPEPEQTATAVAGTTAASQVFDPHAVPRHSPPPPQQAGAAASGQAVLVTAQAVFTAHDPPPQGGAAGSATAKSVPAVRAPVPNSNAAANLKAVIGGLVRETGVRAGRAGRDRRSRSNPPSPRARRAVPPFEPAHHIARRDDRGGRVK